MKGKEWRNGRNVRERGKCRGKRKDRQVQMTKRGHRKRENERLEGN